MKREAERNLRRCRPAFHGIGRQQDRCDRSVGVHVHCVTSRSSCVSYGLRLRSRYFVSAPDFKEVKALHSTSPTSIITFCSFFDRKSTGKKKKEGRISDRSNASYIHTRDHTGGILSCAGWTHLLPTWLERANDSLCSFGDVHMHPPTLLKNDLQGIPYFFFSRAA